MSLADDAAKRALEAELALTLEAKRALEAELVQTREALARTEKALALAEAQNLGLHSVTQALHAQRVEHEERAAMAVADTETQFREQYVQQLVQIRRAHDADLDDAQRDARQTRPPPYDEALERSPDSLWDTRRLILRPLRGAAAKRLNEREQRRARRGWHTGRRRPITSECNMHWSSSSSSEGERESLWRVDDAAREFQDDAARRIQVGLRGHISRRVLRAGFVRAYMTLYQMSRGRLPRVVLVHYTSFVIGPHAHGER